MKTGKTLIELATEIERQRESRTDYVVPTAKMAMEPVTGDVVVVLQGVGAFDVNDLAHRQIGDHIGVPAKYYDRMRKEAPALLAQNVNHWLHEKPETRLFRTLDGRGRAFLSDRFRPLDNADLGEAVLPVLAQMDVAILSCEITERRLYIKVCDRSIHAEVGFGEGHRHFKDVLCPALTISNSEVGAGALALDAGIWTEGCTNMAILKTRSMRKYHLGGRLATDDDLAALLSDKTKHLTDVAVWAQVRDVVKGAFEQARFDAEVAKIQGMTAQPIASADVVKVVELTAKAFGITEGEKPSVLKHLIQGGELSRYGLFNAITRTAEDLEDYDRATEFERMGGEIIELAATDWKRIAEAV